MKKSKKGNEDPNDYAECRECGESYPKKKKHTCLDWARNA